MPNAEYSRLQPHLRPLQMKLGAIYQQPGDLLDSVYFVESGMISLVVAAREKTKVEVGIVGCEGMAGALAALTSTPTLTNIMVQIHGEALVLAANVFRREFKRGAVFQDKVLGSLQSLSVMHAQLALCNRLHSVEKRLARWLLQVYDRVGGDYLELTQERIAEMLGTRRAGVTEAANTLRQAGLIKYNRGCIEIKDRAGLEKIACECYQVMSHEFQPAAVG